MRIGLEITGALGGGGYQRYAESLLTALADMDSVNEYFLYGAFWRGFPERAFALDLPRQKNFHWAIKRFPQGLLMPIEEFSGIEIQKRFLAPLKLDLLHGLGSLLPRLNSPRTVVTLHYAGPWDFKKVWERFYFNRLTTRSVLQADRIIAISEFSKQEALRTWPVPEQKFTVIHHGGAGSQFKPAELQEDPRPDVHRPYFLFIGTLSAPKNPALVAEAFALMKSRSPKLSHKLVFAGPAGDQAELVKDICRQRDIWDQVLFLGRVDPSKVYPLFQQAEAVIFPSIQEGFAIPVLEAMACGTPALGVRAGALIETIAEAGLLSDCTAEALAQQMLRLAQDESLRQELRRKGLAWAKTFSWRETARKTLQVYKEVASTRS